MTSMERLNMFRYRLARIVRNFAGWIDPRTRGTGWVCFHCDEQFANPNLAKAHFGPSPDHKPACVLIQDRGMLYELRAAQQEAAEARFAERRAEEQAEMLEGQMAEYRRAAKAQTCHQLRMNIDSLEGEAITARALIEAIRTRAPKVYAEVIQ